MKRQLLFLFAVIIGCCTHQLSAQVLYSERFDKLTLQPCRANESSSLTVQYSQLPKGMSAINNGKDTMVTMALWGPVSSPTLMPANPPFYAPGEDTKAWLVLWSKSSVPDTAAVSCSWVKGKDTTKPVDMWLFTPTINGVDSLTILSWKSRSMNFYLRDSYEVYVTTDTTGAPMVSDFTPANRLYTNPKDSAKWRTFSVLLSAYAGKPIRIAFHNNTLVRTGDKLLLKNITVRKLQFSRDISSDTLLFYPYTSTGAKTVIHSSISSHGFANINKVTMNYQVGTAPTVTQTFTTPAGFGFNSSMDIEFNTPFVGGTPGQYPVKVWVSKVNDTTDLVPANDVFNGPMLSVMPSVPDKKILMEEATGAWCGFCPDGAVRMDAIITNSTNVIAASVHFKDNMSIPEGTLMLPAYTNSYPSALFDRFYFPTDKVIAISRFKWSLAVSERADDVVPCTVSLINKNYDPATRTLSITVKADFVGAANGNFRLNCYVIENNVFGPYKPGNGWTQLNELNKAVGSPFFGKGDYLRSDFYKHQHVVNKMLGGAWGSPVNMPASVPAGGSYSKTYVYTLPAAPDSVQRYVPDNIYLIGLVQKYDINNYNAREIVNATQVKLTDNPEIVDTGVGIDELPAQIVGLNVYPNPANDVSNIALELLENSDLTIHVLDIIGQTVYKQSLPKLSAGAHTIELNTATWYNGLYTIRISTSKGSASRKLTILK